MSGTSGPGPGSWRAIVSPHAEPARPLVERCVVPFYLQMMGASGAAAGQDLLGDIAAVTDDTTSLEVASLLAGHWRPQVMGAWMSVRFKGALVERSLLASIRHSDGDLTAGPLAVAGCLVVPSQAAEAFEQAQERLGGSVHNLFDAALSVLQDIAPSSASPKDQKLFEDLLAVGRRLQAA